MSADDARFDYWHVGQGASVFALASTALAGVVWWLTLRRRSRFAAAVP
jgi:hypothetical protein